MNVESNPSVPTRRLIWRIVRNVAVAAITTTLIAGCSSGVADNPTAADATQPAVSTNASPAASGEATATVGPGRGTGFFGGSVPEVPVSFTLPAGWEADQVFIGKSSNPTFGLAFFDVGNIYAEGCKWVLLDPPPGETVDDLVSAYAKLPGFGGPPRDITVDRFNGKQIQYTVPDYDEDECIGGKFGILQHDHTSGMAPSLWAHSPKQQERLSILDVDGTRLVILVSDTEDMSAQDRVDLDGIFNSIHIG